MALHIRPVAALVAALSASIVAGCSGSASVPAQNGSSHSVLKRTVAGIPGATGTAQWTQPYFNGEHTGFNALERTLKRSNVADLSQLWSFGTGGQLTDPIVVQNGVAYVNSGDGYLYALNATTGTQLWKYDTYEGSSPQNAPLVAGGRIVLPCLIAGSSQQNAMCGINPSTGKRVWSYYVDCNCLPPASVFNGAVASGNTVVFDYQNGGTNTSYVIALDAKNGGVLWTGANLPHGPDFWSSAISGSQVFYSDGSGVCAASLTSGTQTWCTSTGSEPSIAAAAGVVYVNTTSNGVYALKAADGTQIWQTTPSAGNYSGQYDPPAIANGMLYVSGIGCCSPELYGIDASTGAAVFNTAASGGSSNTDSSPSVADGVVYVSCQQGLCAFNSATGNLLFGLSGSSGSTYVSPAIVNGVVYTNCGSNAACAYALPSGDGRSR